MLVGEMVSFFLGGAIIKDTTGVEATQLDIFRTFWESHWQLTGQRQPLASWDPLPNGSHPLLKNHCRTKLDMSCPSYGSFISAFLGAAVSQPFCIACVQGTCLCPLVISPDGKSPTLRGTPEGHNMNTSHSFNTILDYIIISNGWYYHNSSYRFI